MLQQLNDQDREQTDKKTGEEESGLNDRSGSQNASANRGGTTDLDQEALTVDRDAKTERGSGITTKNTVAGSDFDGQLS